MQFKNQCGALVEMIKVAGLSVFVHGCAFAQAVPESADTTGRVEYEFCSGGRAGGCVNPGQGTPLCDGFLAMLNKQGAEAHPVACEVSLDPAFPQFSRPRWERLDIEDHIELVYRLDTQYAPRATLEQTRRVMRYTEWRELFEREIENGSTVPILLKAHLRYGTGERVTVLGYSRRGTCDRESISVTGRYSATGYRLYVYDEPTDQLRPTDDPSFLNTGFHDIIGFDGRYFLVNSDFTTPSPDRPGWEQITVLAIRPESRPGWRDQSISGPVPAQCEFRATFPYIE